MSKRKKGPWYTIYREVLPSLDAHEGKDSINLLIQQLAGAYQYEPKVLARMIRAGRFLDRLLGPLPTEEVRGGYAHIEYIQRLHELNAQEAESLVGMAVAKKVTLEHLQGIIDRYSENLAQSDASKRSKARSLITEHDRETTLALSQCGAGFFGFEAGTIIRVEHSDLLGQFFMVKDKQGVPRVAIFGRLGDTSRKAIKAAAELLKLAKNARSYLEQVWFIFPASSTLAHELAFLATEEKLFRTWLYIATLSDADEPEPPIQEIRGSRHVVSRALLDGADPMAWNGRPLNDARPVISGTLEKITYTFTARAHPTSTLVTDMPEEAFKKLMGEATSVDVTFEAGHVAFVQRQTKT
ncbi:hypothetical protein LMK08_00230 [Metapseudomonas furukawaii]|uniref:hypothetical protein n=1 Tax=Metapseudomonas furukawaii TaxID=1149133 RepID=UPI00227D3173|nr:hypothetical protein [Pseudomonas furukawaii]WAG79130.1 hypothetical protein LMK08_00230 [Pseudomonas furukawaii]